MLNQSINKEKEEHTTEMLDTLKSSNDTSDEAIISIFVQEMLSSLTARQNKIIIATVIEGRTEKDVAEILEVSQPAVHQMKERALNKLKLVLSQTKRI